MEKKAGDEREKKKTGKQDETARKGKKERDRERETEKIFGKNQVIS